MTKLTHLYLQNNLIERIQGLDKLRSLQKLYLDGNRITMVDGLEKCQKLEVGLVTMSLSGVGDFVSTQKALSYHRPFLESHISQLCLNSVSTLSSTFV